MQANEIPSSLKLKFDSEYLLLFISMAEV